MAKLWRSGEPNYLDDEPNKGGRVMQTIGKIGAILIGVYVVISLALGFWWDFEPASFDVRTKAQELAAQRPPANPDNLVIGYTTTATFMQLGDSLLNKSGGYLSNDLFPPGVWMDNIPSWEFGVLTMLRDTARVYRNDFSRSQSQSVEDPDLSEAEGKFFFDNSSWLIPQTEDEYRDGIRYFEAYLDRLANSNETNAQFFARADNLQQWLAAVETRLGSFSQRLSASVGKRQLNIDLAGDAAASQATAAPADQVVKTPWLEIDDVFYETRGFTYALIHMLRALEQDFGDVLDKKNARVSLQQIIRELEPTQDTVWSPMILNGDGLGFLANHSLVMASYIARANAAIIDLRTLLQQG